MGDQVDLQVDSKRRDRIRLNHTATHLLHAALRDVLGDHVLQKGSMVAPDRLRFDFSHHKAVSRQELKQVEQAVYAEVLKNKPVNTIECSMDEAVEQGAMALFGEKYGSDVRVVRVDDFSTELCGGTHASRTGDIGLFRITGESSVAAGVRRIEAETGFGASETLTSRDESIAEAAGLLKTKPEDLHIAISCSDRAYCS